MSQEHSFDYEYSARQQAEVRKIRAKYLPEHADTLETLRRLDAHSEKKGSTYSLIIGISGLMILGGGMSLIMVGNLIALGVVTGIAGLALAERRLSDLSAHNKSRAQANCAGNNQVN